MSRITAEKFKNSCGRSKYNLWTIICQFPPPRFILTTFLEPHNMIVKNDQMGQFKYLSIAKKKDQKCLMFVNRAITVI